MKVAKCRKRQGIRSYEWRRRAIWVPSNCFREMKQTKKPHIRTYRIIQTMPRKSENIWRWFSPEILMVQRIKTKLWR